MHDDTVDLHPFWFNSIAVVALLEVVWIVFRDACLVSRTTKTTAVFQRWRLIQVEPSFEKRVQ